MYQKKTGKEREGKHYRKGIKKRKWARDEKTKEIIPVELHSGVFTSR
jgi:hypothetical protein